MARHPFNFLVGRVFPSEHCYENCGEKRAKFDNIPEAELSRLELKGIPLTSGHPPLNKIVADAPDIRRGEVSRSFIDQKGDLWGVSRLNTNTLQGNLLLDDVKRGKQMGLSLGHRYQEGTDERGKPFERYIADHLAVVKNPRRPECYVYQFGSPSDLPNHFTEDHVKAMSQQINSLPNVTTVSVNASAEGGETTVEVKDYPTCSLGTLDPATFKFTPADDVAFSLTGVTELGNMRRSSYLPNDHKNIEELRTLFQGKDTKLANYFTNPDNNVLIPYSRSVKSMLQRLGTIPSPVHIPQVTEKVSIASSDPPSTSMQANPLLPGLGAQPTAAVSAPLAPVTDNAAAPAPADAPAKQQTPPPAEKKQDSLPDPTQEKKTPATPPAKEGEKSADTVADMVKSEEIADEVKAMSDESKVNVITKLMNDAKEKQQRILKMDAENAKLKEEAEALQKEKEAFHKEEREQLDNKISSFMAKYTEATKKKVAGTPRESQFSNPTELNSLLDLPMDKKRTFGKLMEFVAVASEDQGELQHEENVKRRRTMSEDTGNSSFYSRFNDTLGVPDRAEKRRPPPTNLANYLTGLGANNDYMNVINDESSGALMASTMSAENQFMSNHNIQPTFTEPKLLQPY